MFFSFDLKNHRQETRERVHPRVRVSGRWRRVTNIFFSFFFLPGASRDVDSASFARLTNREMYLSLFFFVFFIVCACDAMGYRLGRNMWRVGWGRAMQNLHRDALALRAYDINFVKGSRFFFVLFFNVRVQFCCCCCFFACRRS